MTLGDIILGVLVPVGIHTFCAVIRYWPYRDLDPVQPTLQQAQVLYVINTMNSATPPTDTEADTELPRYKPNAAIGPGMLASELPEYEDLEYANTQASSYDHVNDTNDRVSIPESAVVYDRTRVVAPPQSRLASGTDRRSDSDIDLEMGSRVDGHETWSTC